MYSTCYFKKYLFTKTVKIVLKILVSEYNLFSKVWGEFSKNLSLSGLKYSCNMLDKLNLLPAFATICPQISVIKILSYLGDTMKPIKLHPITIPDSGLWKYTQTCSPHPLHPGTASIKKTLCNAHMGDEVCWPVHAGVESGCFMVLLFQPQQDSLTGET